jgi:hypothetical protein
MVGSPAYMAPEQVERDPASMKSDIYALGIVMYKMLTASLPFPPDTPAALATRILLGNLSPPSAARRDLPKLFDDIFARATARDPALRYARWEDFADDLRRISRPAGEGSSESERLARLKALPFFRGFTPDTLQEVLAMGRWFEVRAGTELVGEDDQGYTFFVLVRGQMRATRKGTLLAILGAGQSLAETSFLRKSGRRRFTSIGAVTDSTLIEFDPDVLWLASPDCLRHFHQALLASMAERLISAEGALAELMAQKNVTLF